MLPILQGLLVASIAYSASTSTNDYARQRVYEEFRDTPALIDVAFCESTFRQFVGTSTEVLRGEVNHDDVGIMQINEKFNGSEAKKKGIDIYTVDGNIAMAKILYARNGLRDWKSSWSCMQKREKTRQNHATD